MITNKKYTVIVSAWQTSETLENNLIASDELKCYLQHVLKLEPLQAIGFYEKKSEVSFVVHTNQIHTVQHIGGHIYQHYSQICMLVNFNALAAVELHYLSATTLRVERIGTHFETFGGTHQNHVEKPDNYTILNGQYWQVV